ncbi:MAG: transporter substrate-binding domain-containing protein [Gammaproteobacteria bacterium]|nr:transporter substrate-binding domain-containing protein [Gammaproteobacteria bacterium]MCZ6826199.1 transporter substrate-binding domain-containing protein [Gammaproteobacteria bacterium]
MRRISGCTLTVVCLLVLSACDNGAAPGQGKTLPIAETPPEPAEDCTLVVGWDPWEPYQYQDLGGELRGLDVELIRGITARIGCKTRFLASDWSSLLEMLKKGEVDMLPGATKTMRRAEFAMFSDPYRDETFALFVRTGEKGRLNADKLGDLLERGFKIGVVSQYLYGDEITALQDSAEYGDLFVSVPISEMNFSNLMNFEADGFLEDPFVAAAVIRKKGLAEEVEAHPIVIKTGEVRLMFAKASVEQSLVDAINVALGEQESDGSYAALLEKYLN